MKIYKYLLLDVVFFLVLLIVQPSIAAEDFPLSIKGWQATVIRLEGVNTSRALAVGQVRQRNAEEYCDREADWLRDKSGRKISKERCIRDVLRQDAVSSIQFPLIAPEKFFAVISAPSP